jgi:hypothetical protein
VLGILRCLAKFVEMVVIPPLIAHKSILALILGRSVVLGRCVISCLNTAIPRNFFPCAEYSRLTTRNKENKPDFKFSYAIS